MNKIGKPANRTGYKNYKAISFVANSKNILRNQIPSNTTNKKNIRDIMPSLLQEKGIHYQQKFTFKKEGKKKL